MYTFLQRISYPLGEIIALRLSVAYRLPFIYFKLGEREYLFFTINKSFFCLLVSVERSLA